MITVSAATRVFIATGVTDMRKSFNGLYGLVRGVLNQDLLSGHLLIFCNRRRDRIKVLSWDGSVSTQPRPLPPVRRIWYGGRRASAQMFFDLAQAWGVSSAIREARWSSTRARMSMK